MGIISGVSEVFHSASGAGRRWGSGSRGVRASGWHVVFLKFWNHGNPKYRLSGRLQSDAESDDANLGHKYRSLLGGVMYASIATIATMDG